MTAPQDVGVLARRLERSPDHGVLRRVKRRDVFADPIGDTRIGVLLDTETTGLDRREDQVIALAMIVFEFDDRAQVCRILERAQAFNDPGRAIPAEVVELTGITDAMVAGCAIDPDDIARLVDPGVVVIAHNAGVDRVFAERLHPVFATKAWACSLSEVPWREAGIGSAKRQPGDALRAVSRRAPRPRRLRGAAGDPGARPARLGRADPQAVERPQSDRCAWQSGAAVPDDQSTRRHRPRVHPDGLATWPATGAG